RVIEKDGKKYYCGATVATLFGSINLLVHTTSNKKSDKFIVVDAD
ncbi:MAG: hypothetical protein GY810_22955, partial [Aureispira sp.]|nr:hypothetical protein [Aureispira sp.]